MDKIVISLTIFILISMLIGTASATTYYIDSITGSDSNNGLSPQTAWQTLSKANSMIFLPGDTILLKRGGVWREQLTVSSSGQLGNPITFGAYGEGDPPEINGADIISGDSGWQTYSGNTYMITTFNWPTLIVLNGVPADRGTGKDTLENHQWFNEGSTLYFRDDSGSPRTSGIVLENGRRKHALLINGKSNIVIENLTLRNHQAEYNTKQMGVLKINNSDHITIRNCTIANARYYTLFVKHSSDVLIENCNVSYGLWGIAVGESQHVTVRRNSAFRNGWNRHMTNDGHGIGISGSSDVIVEYSDVYENGFMGNLDSVNRRNAIVSWQSSNVTIRYNRVHDNYAGGITISAGSEDSTGSIYYNLIYNNGRATEAGLDSNYDGIRLLVNGQGMVVANISNNVVYNNNVTLKDSGGLRLLAGNGGTINCTAKNNILFNNIGGWELKYGTWNSGKIYFTADSNIYYRDTPSDYILFKGNRYPSSRTWDEYISSSGETHSINTNPDFANPTMHDSHLNHNSPAIDNGTDVGLSLDFDGNPVPLDGNADGSYKPDIGAYEYSPIPLCHPGDSFIRLNSTHLQACSCNQSDVQATINAANYGDTILVPEGECIWNSTLIIEKGIQLIGAGINKTIITIDGPTGYENAISFNADETTAINDYAFTLFGFTFKRMSDFYAFVTLSNQDLSHALTRVTVHDNEFINLLTGARAIGIIHYPAVFGVIYNNTIQDVSHAWRFLGSPAGWNQVEEWKPGTGNAMYYEDNYVYLSRDLDYDLIVSGGEGNRYVARYNTINLSSRGSSDFTQAYDIHGNQINNNGAGIGFEAYGNLRIGASGRWVDQRGGQVFFFYNQWTNTSGTGTLNVWEEYNDDDFSPVSCPADSAYKKTSSGNCLQRAHDSYYWRNFGGMDGTSPSYNMYILFDHYDRNKDIVNNPLTLFENDAWFRDNTQSFDGTIDPVGSCGYYKGPSCTKSGIGCGTLEEMNSITPTAPGLGFWVTNQSCTDISDMTGKNHKTRISGTLYMSVENGNGEYEWLPYYKPYIYPHPLRVAPFGTKICGEGQITEQCWCQGLKNTGYCCHGYYQTRACGLGCYEVDTDCNGKISIKELLAFIEKWKRNEVSLKELIQTIIIWKREAT